MCRNGNVKLVDGIINIRRAVLSVVSLCHCRHHENHQQFLQGWDQRHLKWIICHYQMYQYPCQKNDVAIIKCISIMMFSPASGSSSVFAGVGSETPKVGVVRSEFASGFHLCLCLSAHHMLQHHFLVPFFVIIYWSNIVSRCIVKSKTK